MLNKKEVVFALSIAREGRRSKNKNVLSQKFKESWGVGTLNASKKTYRYNPSDIKTLRALLEQSGINSGTEVNFGASRNETAIFSVKEKNNAKPVFPTPIAIKVLEPGAKVNGDELLNPPLAHTQIDFDDIQSIEAKYLILVENLETFKKIHEVDLSGSTSGYLFIWRGGPFSKLSIPNTEKQAASFSTKFRVPLIYFGDYDLKGISIGLDLKKATGIILPNLTEVKAQALIGDRDAYQDQLEEFSRRKENLLEHKGTREYFEYLMQIEQSFTQERLSAFNVTHSIIATAEHD